MVFVQHLEGICPGLGALGWLSVAPEAFVAFPTIPRRAGGAPRDTCTLTGQVKVLSGVSEKCSEASQVNGLCFL
jgi:hypothetical protein